MSDRSSFSLPPLYLTLAYAGREEGECMRGGVNFENCVTYEKNHLKFAKKNYINMFFVSLYTLQKKFREISVSCSAVARPQTTRRGNFQEILSCLGK
jgi:hypothetical protein